MDRELLGSLYRRYERELYLYLYSLCKSKSLAEDLLQETFLKALLSLPDGHTNMRAWLYLVARNLYFNYFKREKNRFLLEKYENDQKEGAEDVLEQLIADENRRMLYRALGKLEQRKREVLLMQYFGGLTQKEIGVILHITKENVRVLVHRARRELRFYMEVEGYDIP